MSAAKGAVPKPKKADAPQAQQGKENKPAANGKKEVEKKPAAATNGNATRNGAGPSPKDSARPQNGERKPRENKPAERKPFEKKDAKQPATAAPAPAAPKPKSSQPIIEVNPAVKSISFLDKLKGKKEEEAKTAAAATPALPETEKKASPKKERAPKKAAAPAETEAAPEKKEKPAKKEAAAEEKKPATEAPKKEEPAAVLPPPKKEERKPRETKKSTEKPPAAKKTEDPAPKKEASEDIEDKLNKPDASKDPVVVPKAKKADTETASWSAPVSAPRPVADVPSPAKAAAPAQQRQQPAPSAAPATEKPVPARTAAPAPAAASTTAPVPASVMPTVHNYNRQSETISMPNYVKELNTKTAAGRKYRFHQPTQEPSLSLPANGTATQQQQQAAAPAQPAASPVQQSQSNPQALAYQQQLHRDPANHAPFTQPRRDHSQWSHPGPSHQGREGGYGRNHHGEHGGYGQREQQGYRYTPQAVRPPGSGYNGSYGSQASFRPPQAPGNDMISGFHPFKDTHGAGHGAGLHGAPGAHREHREAQQPIGRPAPQHSAVGGWGMEPTNQTPL